MNDEAPQNISYIVVTLEVSHALMSSLKEAAWAKRASMSVTALVTHVEMWPYNASAAAASASHAATAVLMLPSVMTLFTVGRGAGTGVGRDVGTADGA